MPKLLLVEDNEFNRDMLSRRLQRRGYEVIFAPDGGAGVSMTLRDKPDLVLMDLNLPGMNGWEAARQLKANPQSQNIPVIALTAYAIAGDREKALAAGCDEYDTKPINLPRLVEKIEMLLQTKSQRQEPSILQDSRIELVLILLRQELCIPMNTIIGYSEMLLDELKYQRDSTLFSDLQKILACGTQMLSLANTILNPVQLEINLNLNIDTFSSTIRLELLTPLSTAIGYCEMLLEEANAEFIPDLDKINVAAQQLLSMINDITKLAAQQLQALDANGLAPDLMLDAITTSLVQTTTTIHSLNEAGAAVVQSTLLVVDDNETDCFLLKRQLERQGYTVATATNGPLALQMLKAMPYDLILLDMIMPGMNGFEMVEQLKRHEDWCHIPVIVISALDEIDNVVRCVEMGAEDYVFKPFKPVLVRTKIAACLQKKLLRQQALHCFTDEKYRNIFENAPEGIYQSTPEGYFISVNPAMARIYGYEPAVTMEAVTEISHQIYVDPNSRDEFRRLVEAQGYVTEFEYQAYRQDGDIIWVSDSARVVQDVSGQLYYEGIVKDITQRKLAETALKRQVEELQIEIDQFKRARQVTEIIHTDYFQQLKAEVENLGCQDDNGRETGPKVLLVEDNEMNRDMLSRRLQRSGYEVEIAVDGAEGVAKTASEKPDLVLMDMSLPVMDGWEATQQLKANPQTRHIPIIALTAHVMAGDRETALAAGCDDYDTKPIELPRLLGKIETLLKKVKSYR